MSSLSQLLQPEKREAVVADIAALIERTIAEQSGLSGIAIKGAVSAAKAVDSSIVPRAVGRLLPKVLGELEPCWTDYQTSPSEDFGNFAAQHSARLTQAIMAVTDAQAESLNAAPLKKIYSSLRTKAAHLAEPKIPDFARIIDRHM